MLSFTQTVVLILSATFFYSLHGIIVNLSRNENGQLEYHVNAVILISEVVKFLISLCLFLFQSHGKYSFSLRETLWLSLPAIIYTVNNSLGNHFYKFFNLNSIFVIRIY